MDPVKWLHDEVGAWKGVLGGHRLLLTLSYLRELSAAIAERDAEIERLRGEVEQSQSQARAWKEDAGRQAMFAQKRPTPTLAEVAMHFAAAQLSIWDASRWGNWDPMYAVDDAEALLAELARRGK